MPVKVRAGNQYIEKKTIIIFPDIGKGKKAEQQKIFDGSAERKQKKILTIHFQRLKLGEQSPVKMEDI